jgi:hypothetical protein
MATSVNALRIRRVLGRGNWSTPSPHGPDGWSMVELNGQASVIVSVADHGDDEWIHASIARPDRMPSYDDLKLLHAAVFGDGWAYQVFAPPSDHVNIHKHALHLWGRLDGAAVLPDFTDGTGSI